MKRQARWVGVGALLLALGIGWMVLANRGQAADPEDVNKGVLKLADMIKAKDEAGAKKLVTSLCKGLYADELMIVFGPRKDDGIGVGTKAGSITPDGIELKIQAMERRALTSKQLEEEAPALTQMAYVTAAGAKMTRALAPDKDMGKRKKADWLKWSDDMEKAALELAAVTSAAKKDPNAVKAAATKLNASCINCHNVFRQ